MLVAEPDELRVRQVAGDVEGRLGLANWEGGTLTELLGAMLGAGISERSRAGAVAGFIGQLATSAGETLDVSSHISGPWVIVELEPASVEASPASLVLNVLEAALGGFERAGSLAALCDRAAIEFRRFTGFDRGDGLPLPR